MNDPTTRRPPAGRVSANLSCSSCGYNLRTLAFAGKCPECGRAVLDTVRMWKARLPSTGSIQALEEFATMLAWTPIIATGLVAVGSLIGLYTTRFTWYAMGIGVMLMVASCVYTFASVCFVATCLEIVGRVRRFRRGIVALPLIALVGAAASRTLNLSMTAQVLAACLIMVLAHWTARNAQRVIERAAAEALGRSAATTALVTLIALALLGAWVLSLAGIFSGVRGAEFALRNVAAPVIFGGVCPVTLAVHVAFMFRLRRWLCRAEASLEFIRNLDTAILPNAGAACGGSREKNEQENVHPVP